MATTNTNKKTNLQELNSKPKSNLDPTLTRERPHK